MTPGCEKLIHIGEQGNILLTNELIKRYGDRGLIGVSVHPGLVATDLARNHGSLLNRITKWFAMPPEQGAIQQLWAATTDKPEELNGKYLVPIAQIGEPSARSRDEKLAREMWEWCEGELKGF